MTTYLFSGMRQLARGYLSIPTDSNVEGIPNDLKQTVWKERKVQYGVKNILLGTGTIAAVVMAFDFFAPNYQISFPTWLLGGFAGTISVITCVGGCCLWRTISKKTFEDIDKSFKESIGVLKEEKENIDRQLSLSNLNMKNLEEKFEELQKSNADLKIQLDETIKELEEESKKAQMQTNEVQKYTAENEKSIVKLEVSTAELRECLNQTQLLVDISAESASMDKSGTDDSTYYLRDIAARIQERQVLIDLEKGQNVKK